MINSKGSVVVDEEGTNRTVAGLFVVPDGGGESKDALKYAGGDDNPGRLNSEAALAKLCGVAPLESSSGKTVRHRLNRSGNRQANRTLRVVDMVRLRRHQPTRDYLVGRLAEGKTKKEVTRCQER